MANQKISQLANAGTLTGNELVEIVQGGVNVKTTLGQLLALAAPAHVSETPNAGTYDDVVLPGALDYVFETDTTDGDVEYTGWIAQRDAQRLTYIRRGANNLKFGALTGSGAGNQIRMSDHLSIADSDSITFQFSSGAAKWFVV